MGNSQRLLKHSRVSVTKFAILIITYFSFDEVSLKSNGKLALINISMGNSHVDEISCSLSNSLFAFWNVVDL